MDNTRTPIAYKAITSFREEFTSYLVDKHLADGWHLYGNLCITVTHSNEVIYVQAMVRYEPVPPPAPSNPTAWDEPSPASAVDRKFGGGMVGRDR